MDEALAEKLFLAALERLLTAAETIAGAMDRIAQAQAAAAQGTAPDANGDFRRFLVEGALRTPSDL